MTSFTSTKYPTVLLKADRLQLAIDVDRDEFMSRALAIVRRSLSGMNIRVVLQPPSTPCSLFELEIFNFSDEQPVKKHTAGAGTKKTWKLDTTAIEGLAYGAMKSDATILAGAVSDCICDSCRALIMEGRGKECAGLRRDDISLLLTCMETSESPLGGFSDEERVAFNALLPAFCPSPKANGGGSSLGRGALAAAAVPGAALAAEATALETDGPVLRFLGEAGENAYNIYDRFEFAKKLNPELWGDFDPEKMDSTEALGSMAHDADVAEFFDLTSLAGAVGDGDQAAVVAGLIGSDGGVELGDAVGGDVLEGLAEGLGALAQLFFG